MVVRAKTATTATVPAGIVDLIGTGDAVYSLRKMRGAYTGAAIRVRRSSDNAETDIQFIGMAGIDTAALLSFAGSTSCFVTKWYDQSGNGRDLVQATAGSQPRIVNAGVIDTINGRPTVIFDGVNDTLIGSLNTGISGDVAFTLNMVASYNLANNSTSAIFTSFGSAPIGQVFHYMKNGGSNTEVLEAFGGGTQTNTTIPPTPATLHTRTCVRRPTDAIRWESVHSGGNNGYTLTNTSVVNVTNSPLYVGSYLGNALFSSISICELVFVNSAVEPLNRSMLEMNQGAYYNINVTNFALDLVRSPSAAAFSVRKLRRFYNGSAIIVRRSSDNAEQDIGFTQSGDLDTQSLLSFVGGSSGFVTTWYDQSTNGFHATQASAAIQPIIVQNWGVLYEKNVPSLLFNGGQNISTAQVVMNSGSGNYQISTIHKTLSIGTAVYHCGTGVTNQSIGMNSSAVFWYGNDISYGYNNLFKAMTSLWDGTTRSVITNNTLSASDTPTGKNTTDGKLIIGSLRGGMSYLSGNVSEAIFWNTSNDSQSRLAQQSLSMSYFGI